MVRAIIFDLGKTLVPFDLGRLDSQFQGCREQARTFFDQCETGALDADEFACAMCSLTGMERSAFPEWWNSIFDEGWLVPPATVLEVKSWARLGLMSNTNAMHYEYLEGQRPELRQFDFRILSHVVGAAKPDPQIYEAAEAAAECEPSEILYFDDVPEFVTAAALRGWQARQFRGAREVNDILARARQSVLANDY